MESKDTTAQSPSVVENPFRESILGDPWTDSFVEVPEIAKDPFELCCQEIEAVRRTGHSGSMLLYGQSGSGKTHLIARIRRYLEARAARSWLDSVFISVRLQTSPGRIWRFLRRRLVEDILRVPDNGISQLDRILFRRLASPLSKGRQLSEWKELLQSDVPAEHRTEDALARGLFAIFKALEKQGSLEAVAGELFDSLAGDEQISFDQKRVLQHIYHRRHIGIALAWLRGDSLSEADLATLGLKTATGDEDPEEAARDLILSISRLAGRGTPLVFCFDQVEALQLSPTDIDGFFAFGNLAATLHDLADNIALISCIQSRFTPSYLKSVMGSNYARIAAGEREIPGLTRDEAWHLVQAYLSNASLEAKHIRPQDFDELFAKSSGTVTAREVIARAAGLFPGTAVLSNEDFLAQIWEKRLEAAERTDTLLHADQVLEHGLPILLRVRGAKTSAHPTSPDIQFTFAGYRGPVGVAICNQANMASLLAKFKRLRSGPLPPERIVIVRDPRLPISKNARVTWEQLEELTGSGAHLVQPNMEALAALEALRHLLSESQSGDLANGGDTLIPQTVEQWLTADLPPSLDNLMRDLTSRSDPPDAKLRDQIVEIVDQHYIRSIAQVAASVHCSPQDAEDCARLNPNSIGLVPGASPLVFKLIANWKN